MVQEKEEKGTKKTKKKEKIDIDAFPLEDFGVPPHFPEVEIPPYTLMERPLITRAEWGAVPPETVVPLQLPVNWILFTYTETEECVTREHCTEIVKRLQVQHMKERGLPDIQYNFLAGCDYNVYEGRGWNARPDKNERFPKLIKKNVIEFAYIGNFKDKTPSFEMQKHAWNLIEDSLAQDKLVAKTSVTDDFHDPDDLDLDEILKNAETNKDAYSNL